MNELAQTTHISAIWHVSWFLACKLFCLSILTCANLCGFFVGLWHRAMTGDCQWWSEIRFLLLCFCCCVRSLVCLSYLTEPPVGRAAPAAWEKILHQHILYVYSTLWSDRSLIQLKVPHQLLFVVFSHPDNGVKCLEESRRIKKESGRI